MTFGHFFAILRARKWAALAAFALVVAATLGVSLLLPKQYIGTASVVIDVKPDPITAMVNPSAVMPSFMATQVDILSSERVTLRVIKDLKLADSQQIREQWLTEAKGEGTIEQWLTGLLQRQLDVRPSRESNVINIVYKAPDPRFAAGLANAFVQAYIATTLELRTYPADNFRKFFGAQTKDARDDLERAQAKLSAYQQAKGIIITDERLDVENTRLIDLSSQLTQIQAISAESGSRQSQAVGGQSDRLQEVLSNPLVSGLKAELTHNEAKLQELNSKFGESYPQVIEAKANIAELRSRIDAEVRRVTGGVGVSNTINKSRESQVRASLEAQRAKVLQMKAVRDEGLVLQREVENAQRIYDGLTARLSQTGLEAQNTQSYANMLTVAQPPTEPSSPRILLNTAASIILGGLLAVGVALVLELSDRRVRTPEDAMLALGLPVLGLLPKPGAKRFNPARPALGMALQQLRNISLPAPEAGQGGV